MAVKPIPEGYHAVTPYLLVEQVARLLHFLREAFGAEVSHPPMADPQGRIMHGEVRIGDSAVMMGKAMDELPPMPSTLYLCVDATYRRALGAGASSLREAVDEFYGDRNAGVTDPADNHWWIATHQEDVPPEELARRAQALGQITEG